MNRSWLAMFAPFIVAAALGVWALVIMFFEPRRSRKRPQ